MEFNSKKYDLKVLLNYGFRRVKPHRDFNLREERSCSLWSSITSHECFEHLSDLDEVYALEIEGGRRGQCYYIHTLPTTDGSTIFVVDSTEPDGGGSYAVLPEVLLEMFEDKVIVRA